MGKTVGQTDLEALIADMEPVLNEGEYVFSSISDTGNLPREVTICEMKEKEGVTVVLSREDAESYGLDFGFVAAWITLSVHSSLEAVGLTAAFSSELAKNGISCNVVAGYFHDHLFVEKRHSEKALDVLRNMAKKRRLKG